MNQSLISPPMNGRHYEIKKRKLSKVCPRKSAFSTLEKTREKRMAIHFDDLTARGLGPALILGGQAPAQVWLFLIVPMVAGLLGALLRRGISCQSAPEVGREFEEAGGLTGAFSGSTRFKSFDSSFGTTPLLT